MRATLVQGHAPFATRLFRYGVRRMRGRYLMGFDIVATAFAIYATLCIRYEQLLAPSELRIFMPVALAPFIIRPFINIRFGLYRRVWRFASITELVQIVTAIATGTLIAMGLGIFVLGPLSGRELSFGVSFWLIEATLSAALIGGIRFFIRAASEWQIRKSADDAGGSRIPTLLYGAGHAGAIIARSALHEPKAGVRPVGFLDDDPSRAGKSVSGVPVLGGLSSLKAAMTATNARMLLITMPNAPGLAIRNIMDAGLAAGLEVRTVPPIHELMDGSIDAFRARRVKVDDLLGRPLATDHAPAVDELIRGRTVLITGAGGSIGSELARQVHSLRPERLVLVDRAESPLYTIQRELEVRFLHGRGSGEVEVHLANVVSRHLMRRLVAKSAPDIIFHAAAYKHVPMMEEHPSEGAQVNIAGTMSMLEAAIAANVPGFIFVSTDKAVEPSSIMGATKRVAEAVVSDAARRSGRSFASVRFGNVLGSAGSVVPIFLSQLERGEALTVTDPEMTRYFMTIPEAAWLILDAAALARSGDLFVLDMGEPVRILDLAHDLVRLSGRSPENVAIEYTGLRPGEKLHEQLFYDHESVERTEIAKVLRAKSALPPPDIRQRALDLLQLAGGDNDFRLRHAAFKLVAELATGDYQEPEGEPSTPPIEAAPPIAARLRKETEPVAAER